MQKFATNTFCSISCPLPLEKKKLSKGKWLKIFSREEKLGKVICCDNEALVQSPFIYFVTFLFIMYGWRVCGTQMWAESIKKQAFIIIVNVKREKIPAFSHENSAMINCCCVTSAWDEEKKTQLHSAHFCSSHRVVVLLYSVMDGDGSSLAFVVVVAASVPYSIFL